MSRKLPDDLLNKYWQLDNFPKVYFTGEKPEIWVSEVKVKPLSSLPYLRHSKSFLTDNCIHIESWEYKLLKQNKQIVKGCK